MFKLFVAWIYGSSDPVYLAPYPKEEAEGQWKNRMPLYRLEAFADKIVLGARMNEYVDEMWTSYYEFYGYYERPHVEEIRFVLGNCHTSSYRRSHLRDIVVREFVKTDFLDFGYWGDVMSCDKSFAEEVGEKLKQHMSSKQRCWYEACSIHGHG